MTVPDSGAPKWCLKRTTVFTAVLGLAILALALAIAFWRPSRGPRLLNEPTKAREARPFSNAPDERFAPLPLEDEKHGK